MRGEITANAGLTRLVHKLEAWLENRAIASGGFTFFADYLRDQLRLTAVANELEIMDGKFTGHVIGARYCGCWYKANTLLRLAQEHDIPLAQTVAIGDGANDLLMIKAAGLGIAFHAKPKVNEKTEITIRR